MISVRSRKFVLVAMVAALGCLVSAALAASTPLLLAPHAAPSPSAYVVNPLVGTATFADVAGSGSPGGGVCPHPNTGFNCYVPADIRSLFNFPSGPGAPDGNGQTIILLEAFGSPTLQGDLAAFDSAFNLPRPSLTISGHNGTGDPNDPRVQSWIAETSFDVEWAHAIAPGANLVLAVAKSDDSKDLNRALMRVLPHYPGAIVSQSFGADETFVKQGFVDERHAHLLYASAALLGDTVLASSGDFGPAGFGDSGIIAQYPASDPFVTGVGGTMGFPGSNDLWKNGAYGAEQVWNEPVIGAASGGAPSAIFPSPSYQAGLGNTKRTVPDVSFYASFLAPMVNVFTFPGQPQAFHNFGGVSVGPPIWAGIFALANQLRAAQGPLGFANPALYAILNGTGGSYAGDFHDITAGDNTVDPANPGFAAGPGYDLATGIGTPNVGNLLRDLVAAPGSGLSLSVIARTPDVTCQNQPLTGVYHNVKVERKSWCDLAGATVLGDVRADGASGLGITGAEILGDVQANKVSGTDPLHPGFNVLCNSVVWGKVQIQNSSSAAPWSIGGSACANPDVTGGVGSVVGKDLRFDGNAARTNEISGNNVVKNLGCEHNGGVSGQDNQANKLQGQCAGLGTENSDDSDS